MENAPASQKSGFVRGRPAVLYRYWGRDLASYSDRCGDGFYVAQNLFVVIAGCVGRERLAWPYTSQCPLRPESD